MAEKRFITQGDRVVMAAEDMGLTMTGDRRSFLRYEGNKPAGRELPFRQHGVFIGPGAVGERGHWLSFIAPRKKRSIGERSWPPVDAASAALEGLHALQNYVVLVRSGVIPAPPRLLTTSEGRPGSTATRLGFEEVELPDIKVPRQTYAVDFNVLAQEVTGPEGHKAEQRLMARIGSAAAEGALQTADA